MDYIEDDEPYNEDEYQTFECGEMDDQTFNDFKIEKLREREGAKILKRKFKGGRLIALLSGCLLLSGCFDVTPRDVELEATAQAFADAAEQCLYDVRDDIEYYGDSDNCTKMLDRTSRAYTDNLEVQMSYFDEAVPRHAYIAQYGQKIGWMAVALSNAHHPNRHPISSLW